MSYKTQVLAIDEELNNREESAYPDSDVHEYGISLNLIVEPGYLIDQESDSPELSQENEILLIEGKLSVSF